MQGGHTWHDGADAGGHRLFSDSGKVFGLVDAFYSLMMSQARYSFSSIDSWTNIDGSFRLERFWAYIVKLFDPEDGMHPRWIEDTMDWWRM